LKFINRVWVRTCTKSWWWGRKPKKIEIIDFSDLRRKVGIHALLGYYGYYNLAGFGQVRVMAKAKHELLLIQSTQFEPVVVSVDDSRDFLNSLKE